MRSPRLRTLRLVPTDPAVLRLRCCDMMKLRLGVLENGPGEYAVREEVQPFFEGGSGVLAGRVCRWGESVQIGREN
jgi:hypothetical protein